MHENRVFSHGVATLQAILRAAKHVRILLVMFLKSKLIIFVEMIKFYVYVQKITVLLEMISRKMFYFIGYYELSFIGYI